MTQRLESWTRNPKVASSNLGPAEFVGGGCELTALSSTFNTMTEVPLSKAPNPQLLPGHSCINGCPLLRVCDCVCVHFGWVKCRAQIPSMGHHTWPFVTLLSLKRNNISIVGIGTGLWVPSQALSHNEVCSTT